jgi:formylglycine-generating enzyme required for sulfatase activity
MHGNVWELCDDAVKSLEGTPVRAARGGSWFFGSRECEAAFRITRPSHHRLNNRGMGLRLARVPVGKEVAKFVPVGK